MATEQNTDARMTRFKVGYFVGSLATHPSIACSRRHWSGWRQRTCRWRRSRSRTCRCTATTTMRTFRLLRRRSRTPSPRSMRYCSSPRNTTAPFLAGSRMPSTGQAGRMARTRSRGSHQAVIGTSPGKIGTAVGQQHLRSILAFCNSPQMNSIEAYIQFERGLITDDGASPTRRPRTSSGTTWRSFTDSFSASTLCFREISRLVRPARSTLRSLRSVVAHSTPRLPAAPLNLRPPSGA